MYSTGETETDIKIYLEQLHRSVPDMAAHFEEVVIKLHRAELSHTIATMARVAKPDLTIITSTTQMSTYCVKTCANSVSTVESTPPEEEVPKYHGRHPPRWRRDHAFDMSYSNNNVFPHNRLDNEERCALLTSTQNALDSDAVEQAVKGQWTDDSRRTITALPFRNMTCMPCPSRWQSERNNLQNADRQEKRDSNLQH